MRYADDIELGEMDLLVRLDGPPQGPPPPPPPPPPPQDPGPLGAPVRKPKDEDEQ